MLILHHVYLLIGLTNVLFIFSTEPCMDQRRKDSVSDFANLLSEMDNSSNEQDLSGDVDSFVNLITEPIIPDIEDGPNVRYENQADHSEETIKYTSDEKITEKSVLNKSIYEEHDNKREIVNYYEIITNQKLDGSCTCVKETFYDQLTNETICKKVTNIKVRVVNTNEDIYEKIVHETCTERCQIESDGMITRDQFEHEPKTIKYIKNECINPCNHEVGNELIPVFSSEPQQSGSSGCAKRSLSRDIPTPFEGSSKKLKINHQNDYIIDSSSPSFSNQAVGLNLWGCNKTHVSSPKMIQKDEVHYGCLDLGS